MEIQEAIIEIKKVGEKLSSVKALMPVLVSQKEDLIDISLPCLGLKTYCLSEDQIDSSIDELITSYVLLCESEGLGLADELAFFKWEQTSENLFSIEPKENPILENFFNNTDTSYSDIALQTNA